MSNASAISPDDFACANASAMAVETPGGVGAMGGVTGRSGGWVEPPRGLRVQATGGRSCRRRVASCGGEHIAHGANVAMHLLGHNFQRVKLFLGANAFDEFNHDTPTIQITLKIKQVHL